MDLTQRSYRNNYKILKKLNTVLSFSMKRITLSYFLSLFISGPPLLCVGMRDSWAVDCSRAWDCAIPERWTAPARGIARFLGGGLLPRVELRDSWAVDYSRAWEFAILERSTAPARRRARFLGGGPLPRVGLRDFWAVDYSCA